MIQILFDEFKLLEHQVKSLILSSSHYSLPDIVLMRSFQYLTLDQAASNIQ